MSSANETTLLRQFGRQLAAVRKSRRLTQAQLAEKVNMSVVAIAYLETGKRWARIGTLAKISKALDVSLHDLFDI